MPLWRSITRISVFSSLTLSLLGLGHAALPSPEVQTKEEATKVATEPSDLQKFCFESLKKLPGNFNADKLKKACVDAAVLKGCTSHQNSPIFHFDRVGEMLPKSQDAKAAASEATKKGSPEKVQKILVFALIHGDEIPSGSVARLWMERLTELGPRNHWRLVPVLNPDGVAKRTRTNGRGVDVNRNFPTADWDADAKRFWKDLTGSNPRRYPGDKSASENETLCAINHIKDFKPDFIISIHTPLGVLDWDGPKKVNPPPFKPLPWRSLGNFPGSLGRYMWKEHGVPVLTVELKGDEVARKSLDAFDGLQDMTGTVAIQAQKLLNKMGIEKKDVVFIPEGAP